MRYLRFQSFPHSFLFAVLDALPDVRAGTGIAAVRRAGNNGAVTLVTEAGKEEVFDKVVFATHSDVTLRMLGGAATEAEQSLLGAIPYNDNDIYLHTGARASNDVLTI